MRSLLTKCGYDKEVVSMVEQAWNNLDQLAVNTENHIRYMAPSVMNGPEESTCGKICTHKKFSTHLAC